MTGTTWSDLRNEFARGIGVLLLTYGVSFAADWLRSDDASKLDFDAWSGKLPEGPPPPRVKP